MLIATDLDRTMIYSHTAMGAEQFTQLNPVCVEIYRDAPLSYMTARSIDLLADLGDRTPVVPVTTRTPEQYRRITLPFSPRYAVVSNGGRILVDGASDPQWRERIESGSRAGASAGLAEVKAGLAARSGAHGEGSWVAKVREADDLFCYLVVDPSRQPVDFLSATRMWCESLGWSLSQQGRKIYAMPDGVSKSAAIAEVRSRLIADGSLAGDAQLLAAGDGWLDADLLDYADQAIRPRHGELHTLNWQRPHLRVTTASGAAAGQEILEWFASALVS